MSEIEFYEDPCVVCTHELGRHNASGCIECDCRFNPEAVPPSKELWERAAASACDAFCDFPGIWATIEVKDREAWRRAIRAAARELGISGTSLSPGGEPRV